jgi:hypothetical protein
MLGCGAGVTGLWNCTWGNHYQRSEGVGEIIWSGKCKQLFCRFNTVLSDVLLWCQFLLLWPLDRCPHWQLVQMTEGESSDSGSSATTRREKYSERNTLKWRWKNATKSRIFNHSFFYYKQEKQLTCCVRKNCFNFVRIHNHNHNNINVKFLNSEAVTTFLLYFQLQTISLANLRKYGSTAVITLCGYSNAHAYREVRMSDGNQKPIKKKEDGRRLKCVPQNGYVTRSDGSSTQWRHQRMTASR